MLEHMPVNRVRKKVSTDERAAEFLGKCIAFVDDAAGRDVAADLRSLISDRAEVAVGVRIVQWSVLRKPLEIVTALNHVKRDVRPVAAAEGVAGVVEVEAPGVAAAFREQLKPVRDGVVSPDSLLEFDTADPAVTVLPWAP